MACLSTSGTSPQFVRHFNSSIAFDLIGDELYSRYFMFSPHSLYQFDRELKNSQQRDPAVCGLLSAVAGTLQFIVMPDTPTVGRWIRREYSTARCRAVHFGW